MPNPVILNTVSTIETVRVQFSLTESDYLLIMRELIKEHPIQENTRENRKEIELILADGSVHNHKGQIDFIDREVNSTTGSILLQASFPNPEKVIRPGQFAKVRAEIELVKGAILVPQKAVAELQGKHIVTVITKDNKVEKRTVKVGQKVGDFWIIKEGIKENDHIVYEGMQKVRKGMAVNPQLKQFVSQTNILENK